MPDRKPKLVFGRTEQHNVGPPVRPGDAHWHTETVDGHHRRRHPHTLRPRRARSRGFQPALRDYSGSFKLLRLTSEIIQECLRQ